MDTRQSQDIYAETLAVFDRSEHRHEPLTTPEVADALNVERRTVYKRLRRLAERGRLNTKETGANSRVWWRPPRGSSTGVSSDVDDDRTGVDYGELFETIPDGVSLHDPSDGTLIDVNQRLCELLGYTREELLSLEFGALHADVPPYTSDRIEQCIQQAATDGPRTVEWLAETKDGDHLPVEVRLRRTTIGGDDRVLAVVRDITARGERERELDEMNQKLRAALDRVEGANFIKNADGRYQYMNDECKEMIGLETDTDIVGLTDEDLFSTEVAEDYRADDRRVLETGEPTEHEEEVPTPRGTRTTLTTKSPLFDADGEPAGVFGIATDITDQKELQEKLRWSKRRLNALLEHSTDRISVTDAEGHYTFVSPSAEGLTGHDPTELTGETGFEYIHPEDRAKTRDQFQQILNDPDGIHSAEYRYRDAEGSWRWVESRGKNRLDDPAIEGIVINSRDITERKKREQELRETSRRLNLALEATDTGVWEWNLETDEVVWSETLERLLGIEPGTFDGTFEAHAEYIHPDDIDRLNQSIDDALDGDGIFQDEFRMHREDGEQIWVMGYGKLTTEDGSRRMIGTTTDITDRKESERALARRESLDPSIELEFHSERLAEMILQQTENGFEFTLDKVVSQPDGTHLVYGTASGMTAKESRTVLDSIPTLGEARLLSTVGDSARYEVSAGEESITQLFGVFDGELQSVVVENETCKLVGEFPETVDPEAVRQALRETYPHAELASQRRIVTPTYLESMTEDLLTERQRTILEMAYHAGYFEQPRRSTGDELADRLGITRQTINGHLRKAQSAIFRALFEETAEPRY